MKDRVNGDVIPRGLIEYLEWKSPDKRSPELVHRDRIEMGMSLDGKHACLYATQEILAQPWLAGLVPTVGLSDVLLGIGRVNDALNHVALAPAV